MCFFNGNNFFGKLDSELKKSPCKKTDLAKILIPLSEDILKILSNFFLLERV